MSEHPVYGEQETVIFRHGEKEFHAFLQDDGSLQVRLIAYRRGRTVQ
jgi:hypothetical protein